MARYWPQFNVPGVVSGVVLEELHRVTIATVPFFCLTEALGSNRKARFVESMDAIPVSSDCRSFEGCTVEAACEADDSVHVMSYVLSIPTPIRFPQPWPELGWDPT